MAYRNVIHRSPGHAFPYEAEAYDAYAVIGVATEGKAITWAGIVGAIAKRKHDGLWATAMIGDGWQNNKGQCKLSRHNAIMTGTGYATAWQAWKHREDKTMNGYKAFFNGQTADIYAETKSEAHDKAVAKFKPSKAKRHMVHVELCEKDCPAEGVAGTQVTTVLA